MPYSPDTNILAYGTATNARRSWILAFGIGLLFLVATASVAWLGLRPSFAVPAYPALLVSVTPNAFSRLLIEPRALPTSWQTALAQKSSWPILLGAYKNDSYEWKTFALMPRFLLQKNHADLFIQTRGFVALVADEPFTPSSKMRYTDQMDWYARRPLADAIAFARMNEDGPSVEFAFYGNRVESEMTFSGSYATRPLTNADISINAQTGGETNPFDAFFKTVPIGNAVVADLTTEPEQINLMLGPTGASSTELLFADDLKQNQASRMLASLNVTENHMIKLPDGSLAVEQRIVPASHLPDQTESAFGSIFLGKRRLFFGTSTTTQTLVRLCEQKSAPIAYFSSFALEKALFSLGIRFHPDHGLLFSQKNGRLVLCFQ